MSDPVRPHITRAENGQLSCGRSAPEAGRTEQGPRTARSEFCSTTERKPHETSVPALKRPRGPEGWNGVFYHTYGSIRGLTGSVVNAQPTSSSKATTATLPPWARIQISPLKSVVSASGNISWMN